MPKRSRKNNIQRDINELATYIVGSTTNPPGIVESEKNPHAVALGRLGGLKGGKARAERLTAEQRKEIARKAAQKRWSTRG